MHFGFETVRLFHWILLVFQHSGHTCAVPLALGRNFEISATSSDILAPFIHMEHAFQQSPIHYQVANTQAMFEHTAT